MANKSINTLTPASSLDNDDLLIIWDSSTNTAQSLTGAQFAAWLVSLANGHGGIESFDVVDSGTAGNGQLHTATVTFAGDHSTVSFSWRDGYKGDQGDQTHVWLKYAPQQPTADGDMGDTPDAWIGIYAGTEIDDPDDLHYTDLAWYSWRGPKGDGVARTEKVGESGLTKHYKMYTEAGDEVGDFDVTDGSGNVSTVNNIAPDGNGDVKLFVSTVSDLGLTPGSATLLAAYTALLANQLLVCPATDFDTTELPLYNNSRATDGTIEIAKGSGTDGWIELHGRLSTVGDWRMFFNSSDEPSGTWIRADLVAESGTPSATSGTISSSATVKRSGLVVVLDYAASGVDVPSTLTKVGTVPTKFAPSESVFGIGLIGFGAATPTCYVEVTSGGDIRVRGNTAQSSVALRCHLTWIQ